MSLIIQFVDLSQSNALLVNNRFKYLINTPTSFRTIFNIYQKIESLNSEIYNDRVQTYSTIIAQEAESLRQLTNQIDNMKHPFSQEHISILQSSCVMLTQLPDPSSVNKEITTNYYTPSVAINKYVAAATELNSYNLDTLRWGYVNSSSNTNASLTRLLNFMTINGKGTLTYYIDKTRTLFFKEVDDAFSSKSNIITITLIVDPVVILILLIMFIPFIFKVQSNLLKIYLHLCQFKDVDIRKWLEECNNSAIYIKASITRMKKIYEAQTFEVTIVTKEQEEKKVEDNKKPAQNAQEENKESAATGKDENLKSHDGIANTTEKTTEGALLKSQGDDEDTAAIIKSKEDVVSERKQKMFSRMTKEKTKDYLFSLLGFTIYIGIFKTADALVFANLCSDTNSRTYFYRLLIDREKNDAMAMFFFREELLENKLQTYFECIINYLLIILYNR